MEGVSSSPTSRSLKPGRLRSVLVISQKKRTVSFSGSSAPRMHTLRQRKTVSASSQ